MSVEAYREALKLGKKSCRASLLQGKSPYLPVLEPLLKNFEIVTQEPLGTIEIPLNRIAGTYYAGRQTSFTHDFLPLMPEGSEFTHKWISLCQAHLNEGISNPIVAYEFMNQFYVVEGHKRVSVLRYFHAVSIRGTVTRILPRLGDSEEERIYADFLHFYKLTGINDLWFSHPGDFSAFLQLIDQVKPWSAEDRLQFRSFYSSFQYAFAAKSRTVNLTAEEAMLVYFHIYQYKDSVDKTAAQIGLELSRMTAELLNRSNNADVNLILKPSERKALFFSPSSNHLRAAFIHDKTPETSSWVYSHELGRRDVEQIFDGQLETICMDGRDTDDAVDDALEEAIAAHYDLIFTTSPRLLSASVTAALSHPKATILNCSLNTSHPSIRTYYIRMYEAEFIMGAIAGALTQNNTIGYIADYPIYGIAANINAFALGAAMVNPRAKILLEWSKTIHHNSHAHLGDASISYISARDMLKGNDESLRRVGLYYSNHNTITNLALSFSSWGKLYEKIIRTYLNGWKKEASDTRPINYWWGMDADVIQLIYSRSLPSGTVQLLELLQNDIRSGSFHPFSSQIRTQDGTSLDFRHHPMTPNDIITMNWLADNVTGRIPTYEELLPEAQALVRVQGLVY